MVPVPECSPLRIDLLARRNELARQNVLLKEQRTLGMPVASSGVPRLPADALTEIAHGFVPCSGSVPQAVAQKLEETARLKARMEDLARQNSLLKQNLVAEQSEIAFSQLPGLQVVVNISAPEILNNQVRSSRKSRRLRGSRCSATLHSMESGLESIPEDAEDDEQKFVSDSSTIYDDSYASSWGNESQGKCEGVRVQLPRHLDQNDVSTSSKSKFHIEVPGALKGRAFRGCFQFRC